MSTKPDHLLLAACAEAARARGLWPKTDHMTLALAEEAGEVVKAALDLRHGKGTQEDLRKEIVQCMAMCIRLAEEGDAALGIPAVQPADPTMMIHVFSAQHPMHPDKP
jgi:hypothetical protein